MTLYTTRNCRATCRPTSTTQLQNGAACFGLNEPLSRPNYRAALEPARENISSNMNDRSAFLT